MSEEKDTIFTPTEIVDMIQQGKLDRSGAEKLIQEYTDDQLLVDPIRVKLEVCLKMFQRMMKDTIGVYNSDGYVAWSEVYGIDQYEVNETIDLSEARKPLEEGQVIHEFIQEKYECFILIAMQEEYQDELEFFMNCHSSSMHDMVEKAFKKYEPFKQTVISILEDEEQENEKDVAVVEKDPWDKVTDKLKDELIAETNYWAAIQNDETDAIILTTFGVDNEFHAETVEPTLGVKIRDVVKPHSVQKVVYPDFPEAFKGA